MIRLNVSKEIFEQIALHGARELKKDATNHWKKELFEPVLYNDTLSYNIKKKKLLHLSNGLGDDKPSIKITIEDIQYVQENNQFILHLGTILEFKNTQIVDQKDSLIQKLLAEKELLEQNLYKDHLTQVYNRQKLEIDLDNAITRSDSYKLAAVFVDADRFKGINDNFGHNTGDKALVYIAQQLKNFCKVCNAQVYRYGGEEFILLCFEKKEILLGRLDDLRSSIKQTPIKHPQKDIFVTVSMGVAFWDSSTSKIDLIKKADDGVYKAKSNGRDRIEVVY